MLLGLCVWFCGLLVRAGICLGGVKVMIDMIVYGFMHCGY